ncbi:MAG: hypothetical protein HUJ80_02530 [Firmicutes bacterium]|nr:hypothetical protein [Bacillota bacterium]
MKIDLKRIILLIIMVSMIPIGYWAYRNNKYPDHLADADLYDQYEVAAERWAKKQENIEAIEITEIDSDPCLMDPLRNARSWVNTTVQVRIILKEEFSEEDQRSCYQSLWDSLSKSQNGFRIRILAARFETSDGKLLQTIDNENSRMIFWEEPSRMLKSDILEDEYQLQTSFYELTKGAGLDSKDRFDEKMHLYRFETDDNSHLLKVVITDQISQKEGYTAYQYREDKGDILLTAFLDDPKALQAIQNLSIRKIELTVRVQVDGGDITEYTYSRQL